ncbi:MAG: 50S ribosomal protein L10 [Gammaproteobacteria bacterium]|nr:MAG: 50S ribosomal protein L10 [Gammaproteobacteria bacterium]
MGLGLDDKKALVAEVNAVAATAQSAVAAHYRGLSVSQMTSLRAKARKEGVYMRVVKNTLARKAVEGTDFACLRDSLKGPTILAFSREEPGAAARVVKEFAKDNETLVAVALAIGGQLYPASELSRVASLPTLQEARSKLLGLFQAPMSQFVRTLAEPPAKFARVLAAFRDKQGGA